MWVAEIEARRARARTATGRRPLARGLVPAPAQPRRDRRLRPRLHLRVRRDLRAADRAVRPARAEPRRSSTTACCPGPSAHHLLGVDLLGRDEFSRILYGARYSLLIGIVAVAVGLSSGSCSARSPATSAASIDTVIMRCMDIMLAIPGLLFAIGIVAMLGPGLYQIMIAVGSSNVPIFARLLRGSILAQRENDFVLAARSVGVAGVRFSRRTSCRTRSRRDRAGHARDGDGDHRRRRPRLPRARPAGPVDAGVGDDAHRRERLPPDRAVARDHPRHRDRPLGPRVQPDRRRPARGARPEAPWPLADALLAVEELRVEFSTRRGTVYAVNGISFEIAPARRSASSANRAAARASPRSRMLGLARARRQRRVRPRACSRARPDRQLKDRAAAPDSRRARSR